MVNIKLNQEKDMKSIKKLAMLVAAGAMLLLGACDPVEDRDELKNSFNPDDIRLEVSQTAGGNGNGLTLKMTTPGVIGHWDYLIDKKYTNETYVVFPIPGTHTFRYVVSTPYIKGGDLSKREQIVKTIDVTIDELDQPLPPAYYSLIGSELEGKTWVFDGSGGDGGLWYFMSDPGNPWGTWWNAGGECCPPPDAAGKIVFDLEGGANYKYYPTMDSEPSVGTFTFNGNFTKLYIGGGLNLPGASENGSGNPNAEYTIVELTPERLVLHTGTNGAGTGWTWVFVPLN